jgi:uncharacterized phage-associated protein
MRFVYDEEKAAHAAAHLLERAGGRMPLLSLMKLLYLADRQALVETGYTITGARMVAMPYGPVLSEVYEAASQGTDRESAWALHVTAAANHVVELRQPAGDALSEYERGVLDQVFERWGRLDRWDLVRFTHELPEWQDPAGSSLAIDPVEILRHEGFSEGTIRHLVAQAEAVRGFRRVVGGGYRAE